MNHSAIGREVEYEKDGVKGFGIITKARKGPAMANGNDKVGSVRFVGSCELQVTPNDGSKPFWCGPYEMEQEK